MNLDLGMILKLSEFIKNPHSLGLIMQFYKNFKDTLAEAKVSLSLEKRPDPVIKKDMMHIVIFVEHPNEKFRELIKKAELYIAEVEQKYGQLFLGDSVRIVVETRDKKMYYLK
jgi:hypothetical protein